MADLDGPDATGPRDPFPPNLLDHESGDVRAAIVTLRAYLVYVRDEMANRRWRIWIDRVESGDRPALPDCGCDEMQSAAKLLLEAIDAAGQQQPPQENPPAEPPFDTTAYVSASKILTHTAEGIEGLTYKRMVGILDGNREIRTYKPSKNRLLIHLADWMRYVQNAEAIGDKFALLDEYADGIEARKAAILAQKQRGK
jgi:hypothetical protein